MPARADDNGCKWLYSTTETRDGTVHGMDAIGIHANSRNAHSAQFLARRQGLHDVQVVRCLTEEKKEHFVCIIGEYVLDHRRDDLAMAEDLPYTWL